MFAVDGWKLPNVVPQKAERKRKEPGDVKATATVKKQKPNAVQSKVTQEPASKKPVKDKSKYTPYGKDKGTSGSNVIPVNKVRKPRPKSPTPEPAPSPSVKVSTKEQKRPGKKPLARPPRSERDKTPEKLVSADPPPTFTGLSSRNLTPLQQKMAAKLSGARFRWINERLYTTTGSEALSLIASKPDMFEAYHAGFRAQVKDWPSNPIDVYHARLEQLLRESHAGGPRVVADLGCGEAMLAENMLRRDPLGKRVQVRSFDLLAANERITAADIANLPLPDDSIHIVIFCLSLMGTDFLSFVREAFRVLKSDGQLWISEIKSRFGDKDAKNFVETLTKIGFKLVDRDDNNKMFIQLDFVRGKERKRATDVVEQQDTKKVGTLLKPCTYKKR